MKIICVGHNYLDHAAEMGGNRPTAPIIFLKPDVSILRNNSPFYYPEISNNVHHEVEVVFKICREGKNIAEQFAHKYYDQVGLGIDFTARDLQSEYKKNGQPWDLSKGFNGSAPISGFFDIQGFENVQNIDFHLNKNGSTVQSGNTSQMIFGLHDLIVHVSKFMTLKKGDLIFTGTPVGVGPVEIGDKLEGFLNNNKVLDFDIK